MASFLQNFLAALVQLGRSRKAFSVADVYGVLLEVFGVDGPELLRHSLVSGRGEDLFGVLDVP